MSTPPALVIASRPRAFNEFIADHSEYVALEKIEGLYAVEPTFAALLVHGDSTRSSLVAIGVVDPIRGAELVNRVLGKSLAATDVPGLEAGVRDQKVRKVVLDSLRRIARDKKLNG